MDELLAQRPVTGKAEVDHQASESADDIHDLEADLRRFERKYSLRSETFYAAYSSGEEPENDAWVLDFSEWASLYRTWLSRSADYRTEVQRLQGDSPNLQALLRAVDTEREDWYRLSAAGLERAYGEDEPEYTEDMIKEPNPDYEEG